jgi:aspartate/methionine/tyrosine aminotransferase
MDVAPFRLERWFDEHEPGADVMLSESGVRSLPADRFDTDPGTLGYVIPTDGDPTLRERIADRYGRSAEEVVCTCGTQEANLLAVLALLDGSTHAVVVTPTYQSLWAVPAAVGAVTRVPLEPPRWTLDVDAVADAIRPETALVVVNSPNNPTGRYHAEGTIRALYDLATDADAHLLCDEVYRQLADDPLPPVASLGDRGVSTTSLSKAYGLAGLRFGWLVAAREVADAARRWKDYTTISPSQFGQHVARQALGRREATILAESHALARENRAIVADWLDDHDLTWHSPTGVVGFPTVPDRFPDGESFCRAVVDRESVVLAPGECFGHPDRFRIGFGLPTDELHEGLDRVGRVIEAGPT